MRPSVAKEVKKSWCTCAKLAIPLNVEHELTRQRRWDKQETQEYMWHFNALKLDKLTSRSSTASYAVRWTRGRKKRIFKCSVMFLNFETKLSHSWQDLVRRRFRPKSRHWRTAADLVCRRFIAVSMYNCMYLVPLTSEASSSASLDKDVGHSFRPRKDTVWGHTLR